MAMTAWNESLVSHSTHVIQNQYQACFYCIHEGLPTSTHTYSTYRGRKIVAVLRFWLAGINLADMTHPTGPLCHSALRVTNCKAD